MGKFNDIIQASTPILVDFHATWCGPCKMMSPILEEFKKAYGAKVRILKIDVDKNPEIANRFKVRGVPTLSCLKKANYFGAKAVPFHSKHLNKKSVVIYRSKKRVALCNPSFLYTYLLS